jgi:hypothetical protein
VKLVLFLSSILLLTACNTNTGKNNSSAIQTTDGSLTAHLVIGEAQEEIHSVLIEVLKNGHVVDSATVVAQEIQLPGANEPSKGADAFFTLLPGVYETRATPLGLDGTKVADCDAASSTATVFAGETTELVLTMTCHSDAGGLDVIVTTHDAPTIVKLTFEPGKFIQICEHLKLTLTTQPQEGLTFEWTVPIAPTDASFTLIPNGNTAEFSTFTPGEYGLHVAVKDAAGTVSGLSFPVHVQGGVLCNETAPGEGVVFAVAADPKFVTGNTFPHVDIFSEEGRNEEPGLRVPRGELRGPLAPQLEASQPQRFNNNIPQPVPGLVFQTENPVVFAVDTAFGNRVSFSGVPPDMSGASGKNVVLSTGNTFAALSTDGGATFIALDPTTIFPNTPGRDAAGNLLDGGLCCDQIVQYVPRINRFVWLMQFWGPVPGNLNGPNMLRIASASPEDIVASGGTAWTYWDLRSSTFGLGSSFMDYPDMSVGTNSLYVSVDQVGTGLLVVRIPLGEIADSVTINMAYTDPANSANAYGGHLTQNTGDEIWWAGHMTNSKMRIWSLHEGSNTYFWRDVDINSWPNSDYTSNVPGGTNWLAFGFPGAAVIGATRRDVGGIFGGVDRELWFAWNAGRGGGFKHPHIQMVRINGNDYTVIEQVQIWNPDHAFAYPSLATNSLQEIGMALAWGGGSTFQASPAVGIWGDFVVWVPEVSDVSLNRFGDYLTVRQADPNAGLYSAFVYTRMNNPPPATGSFFNPHYILFGRNSVVHPPPPPG